MSIPSLFAPQGLAAFTERVRALRPDAARVWGKMDVAQMCAHLRVPFAVASGERSLPRTLIGRILGGYAKRKFVLGDAPFGRGLPTDKSFVVPDARDFERERSALLGAVEAFGRAGPAGLTKAPHPFFGELTPEGWDRLMAKHLDHHLRQFGA
jgi:hypothetical protein